MKKKTEQKYVSELIENIDKRCDKISVVKLQQLARRMIKNCDRWKANWEKVLEEIEPEVQKHFNNTVDRLCKDLSDEEIKILISKIKQLKEEQKDE